ncbi:MAG: hypothetical protein OES57_08925, partial [Acidimicrobiia bacterium]|nr:hypothetical protein [Acidimicrobiia bacterium]
MNLDERLRRHLSEQADRFDLAATPTVGAVSAQATHRRRRRAAAIGIGILAGAAGTFAVALVGRDDVVRPPAVAVAPTATAAVEQPPLTTPPASRPLDEASVTVRPGQAEVADVELRHTAAYPELVQLSVDAEGFLLADPFARALLRSEDGERWTDLDPDLPDSLVSAPSASVGAQHAVFGGVRPGLSAPWSRSNLVAAFSADLTHWRLTDLPVPMTTPQRVEDVVVFEGTTGEFVALGSLTVDFEALVWERLSDEVRVELLRSLEGSASYSQWVLVVDGDRVAIELHRFAAGAVRVLYESTVDELGLRDFVGANGPHSQRRYVAWTLGPDGLPEARRAVGLPLTDIIGSGRMGDSVWALGTERDGSAALYRSADGVHWTPVDL